MALAGISTYSCSSSDDDSGDGTTDHTLNKGDGPIPTRKYTTANNHFSGEVDTHGSITHGKTVDLGTEQKTSADPFSDEDSDTGNRTGAAYFFEEGSSSEDEPLSQTNDRREPADSRATTNSLPNPLKLPAPTLGTTALTEGTVFGNKYADNEKAKRAVLEKHVTMTEETSTNNRVCFKFRKGQCKRGRHCRYSHDLGFQAPGYSKTEDESEEHFKVAQGLLDDTNSQPNTTKRRPGVTNTLYPAKRAKQSLDNQRQSQRPWTVGL